MIILYATGRVVSDLANDMYWNSVEVNKSIHTFKHTTVRNTFFFHIISMKILSL
jgi:hypothetical protein